MTRAAEEIKERLCDELNEYAEKSRWTERDVEMIDKISHSIKSLMKYLEMSERWDDNRSFYSRGRSMDRGRYYRDDYSYDNRYYDDRYRNDRYYDNGSSMNRGGYSRDDGDDHKKMIEELENMISNTSDTDIKEAMKKTLSQLKKMSK